MIRAQLEDLFMIVLEPENLDRIKKQVPVHIPIPEGCTSLMIAFTPDVQFVCDLVRQGVPMAEALAAGMEREEVHDRPVVPPEEFHGVKVAGEEA